MNNNISITGNLGKDPELKTGAKGGAYVSLSVPLSSRSKIGNEWIEGETDWYKVTFFGAKAEQIAGQFHKGQRVKVTGQNLRDAPWTDKQGIHHEGGRVIGNAEIELAPWETKAKTDTAPPNLSQNLTQTAHENGLAPF